MLHFSTPTVALHHADCMEALREMEENSIDACVTDPPYELGFMGKAWDRSGVAYMPAFWSEVLRVLKPGAHLLAFGGTRTYHRMACAIEDAEFEIRDQIGWAYGSGFPKSLDVSKAIDKAAGAEREIVGTRMSAYGTDTATGERASRPDGGAGLWVGTKPKEVPLRGGPATSAAEQWNGWGTALKPAWEPICLARKPLSGTVAENVLQHGTGALNINGCRVEHNEDLSSAGDGGTLDTQAMGWGFKRVARDGQLGRWPANVIHDGSPEVLAAFPESSITGKRSERSKNAVVNGTAWLPNNHQSREHTDCGSAARFFYCPKASRSDREEGCDHLPLSQAHENVDREPDTAGLNSPRAGAGRTSGRRNNHPTVKPTELMRYLCRLITPPGGVVLDPFAGSGSTGKAALLEGFRFIGIEREEAYVKIAAARLGQQPTVFTDWS